MREVLIRFHRLQAFITRASQLAKASQKNESHSISIFKMRSAVLLLLSGLLSLGFAVVAQGYAIPAKLQSFYNSQKSGTCSGSDRLSAGFYDTGGGSPNWYYCQKGVTGKAIYLKGPSTYANMDIDCDGNTSDKGDGRCNNDPSRESETAFDDELKQYGIQHLDAYIHPYVVFGNGGTHPSFDPQSHGVKPLSVMAVVCGNKLIYGIWGDTNGDADHPVVGEASLALATACFGTGVNGDSGHDQTDVLYIAFTGSKAVPGAKADWKAKNYADFEASIKSLGDSLVGSAFG